MNRPIPTVLLTGFAPFGGDDSNPSWDAVSALDGEQILGHRIATRCLPVEFGASLQSLRRALDETAPVLAICVGQAGGRAQIALERVAINVDDARIADNAGAQPIDEAVIAGGPAAYFSDLPIKAMLSALRDAGIPAEISQTAGTYVCNHVFYGLMHLLATRPGLAATRGGLIHVPWLPEQGQPSMALDDIARGLEVAIHCALTTGHDIRKQAGALN
jgi:pyroglutamyl-peptidase